jgi:hypothetical protein
MFVLLGGADSTGLDFVRVDGDAVEPNVELAFATDDGSFITEGICRTGDGARFVLLGRRARLERVTPDPARSRTSVEFRIPVDSPVSLSIHDAYGRMVLRSAEAEFTAGTHRVDLDVSDLPSGVYLLELRTKNDRTSRKLVVVK